VISPGREIENIVFLFIPQRKGDGEKDMDKRVYNELGGIILDASITVHRELELDYWSRYIKLH
jgi:hypothetical protein